MTGYDLAGAFDSAFKFLILIGVGIGLAIAGLAWLVWWVAQHLVVGWVS